MPEPTPAMNFCPQCGTQRPAGMRFCPSCGLDYWKQAAAEAARTPVAPRTATPQPVAAEASTDVKPSSGFRLGRPAIFLLILVIAGVALIFVMGGLNFATFGEPGAGEVSFGTSVTDDGDLTGERSTFEVGDNVAFRAVLNEQANTRSLTGVIAERLADGAETGPTEFPILVSDPDFQIVWADLQIAANADDVGRTYVVRIYRGDTELAEGSFTVAE